MPATVHGTAMLIGAHGVLIRGASGTGKSGLANALISRGARLIADDRVWLSARSGRLIASVPAAIAGMLELRGRGLVAVPREPFGVIHLVADFEGAEELDRMPDAPQLSTALLDITLPRQPIPAAPERALPLIEAALAALSPRGNMGLRSASV
jgi:HPr kinase/phosphorylase